MMNVLLVAGMAWGISAPAPKEVPKKETLSPIIGVWNCESLTVSGQALPRGTTDWVYEFTAEGKMIIRQGKDAAPKEQAFTVNDKKEPSHIDWVIRKNAGTIQGIYKVDGDTLTVCFSDGYEGKRPVKFESLVGSKEMLFKFKRAPKKE
jgi:uncharacterized protein (TIGR03067 family)